MDFVIGALLIIVSAVLFYLGWALTRAVTYHRQVIVALCKQSTAHTLAIQQLQEIAGATVADKALLDMPTEDMPRA